VCKLCRDQCNTGEDAVAAWRDGTTVQAIEKPCDKYDCSIKEATESVTEASVCAAAALLMVAAAYA
jgi:hypothetical protein